MWIHVEAVAIIVIDFLLVIFYSLNNNQLGDDAGKALAKALKTNQALRELE